MTSPTLRTEWDDARLDAAFRNRFSVVTPANLGERIHHGLAGARPTRWTLRLSPFATGVAVAVAIVAVVVVGSSLLNVGPGKSPTPGVTSPNPSSSPASPPVTGQSEVTPPKTLLRVTTKPVSLPSGGTVDMPDQAQNLTVQSAADAIAVRDRGVDSSELAVSGWFERNVVPCALRVDNAELDKCSYDFTWLMAAPEQLSVTDATGAGSVHAPVGPAINLVTDWLPAKMGVPEQVALFGHFDDPAAARCSPDRQQVCRDRFVVDLVAWTVGSLPSDVPGFLDELTVKSVAQALAWRDNSDEPGAELAVAGWYDPVLASLNCNEFWAPPLMGYCATVNQYLMAGPEPIVQGRQQAPVVTPTSLAFNVAFGGGGGLQPSGRQMPDPGEFAPTEIVLIGHFRDRRAALCPADVRQVCLDTFVVDTGAWQDGHTWDLTRDTTTVPIAVPTFTPPQRAAISGFLAAPGPYQVINVGAIAGDQIGGEEPTMVQSTEIDFTGSICLIKVIQRGTPGTSAPDILAIDPTGKIYTDRGDGVWVLSGLNP
jgi:hypothetical protein